MADNPQTLLQMGRSLFAKCDTAIKTLQDYPKPWSEQVTALEVRLNQYISSTKIFDFNIRLSSLGNDLTADGTAEKPFKTLKAALNYLPDLCTVNIKINEDSGPVDIGDAQVLRRVVVMNSWPSPTYTMEKITSIGFGGGLVLYAGSLMINTLNTHGYRKAFHGYGGTLVIGGYYGVKIGSDMSDNIPVRLLYNSYESPRNEIVLARVSNKSLDESSGEYAFPITSHAAHLGGDTQSRLWQTTGITKGE